MFRCRFPGRSICVITSICSGHILFFSRRFFSSHNCKLILFVTGKYFLRSFWLYMGHFVPVHFFEASVALGKQFRWRIRRLLLSRVLSKDSKVVFAMFIWRLSSIFDLGLCVLIGQSELSTLCPVPGLLIYSPGYEVVPCVSLMTVL